MRSFGILILLIFYSLNCNAVLFQDPSLSLLKGKNYKVDPEEQLTLTFEYVAAWHWGDLFTFVDITDFDRGGSTYYGEFSPRFKLIELSANQTLSKLYFATTFERGKGGLKSYLYGLGADFKVPGFNYVSANLYQRNNPDVAGKGYQLTTVWGYQTKFGAVPILIDGFFDWTFSSDESDNNFHFNPQIKIDMKQWLNTNAKWYLGIEYDYWKDKYGISDSAALRSNQNTFSLLAKWHF